jgi:hypothetical protein
MLWDGSLPSWSRAQDLCWSLLWGRRQRQTQAQDSPRRSRYQHRRSRAQSRAIGCPCGTVDGGTGIARLTSPSRISLEDSPVSLWYLWSVHSRNRSNTWTTSKNLRSCLDQNRSILCISDFFYSLRLCRFYWASIVWPRSLRTRSLAWLTLDWISGTAFLLRLWAMI